MKLRADDQESDYAAFGRIVLLWGQVEDALADIILTLTFPPLKLGNHKGVPKTFSQKCLLAIRGFETISAMSEIRDEAVDAIASLAPLHTKRSLVVHGHFQGLSINGYLFTIYDTREKCWKFETFTEVQVSQLGQQIVESRKKLGRLSVDANKLRAKYHQANLRSR